LNAEAQTSEPEVAPAAEAPTEEIATLKAALEAAVQASAAARDAQLRNAAELDNVRKRAQRDIENAHRFALERFASELLGVRDSLELAARSAAGADAQALAAGQQATLQLLAAAFEKYSIQRIDPLGVTFDPSLHEAVAVQESSTARPDSVLQVLQSGYQLNGRLLRPARVIVARAPPAAA
jgi:molecular chaperone GrpE